MKRETFKTVAIGERTFKIEKFTAETGSYILFILMEKFLPGALEDKAGLINLPKNRQSMSREEFLELQRDCLSVVSEVLKAGDRPVINANGSWGVEDLERNTPLVVMLTVHAIAYNLADFFAGEGLKELVSSLPSILPVNTPI